MGDSISLPNCTARSGRPSSSGICSTPSTASGRGRSGSTEVSACMTRDLAVEGGAPDYDLLSGDGGSTAPRSVIHSTNSRMLTR